MTIGATAMRPQRLSMAEVVRGLRPGMTVFVPGTSGESLAFAEALKADPGAAAGVRFVGVLFPGINDTAYVGLHPEARQRAYFMMPGFRPGFLDGRVELLPVDYLGAWRDLANLDVDLAIAQVSEPDADGRLSLGICHDFVPAVWARAHRKVAHINARMPRTRSGVSLKLDECDVVVEADGPLVTLAPEPANAPLQQLACHVAGIVRDGDTLQLGIGRMVTAVLESLASHRRLSLHAGMATEAVLPLLERGVIDEPASITVGVALGGENFYRRAAEDERFRFAPVSETHDVRRIAAIDNFVAINAAIEVDLLGQVNCDSLGGRLVAGTGGMPAFAHGAKLSAGGRTAFALLSTASRGAVSRIVPRLDASSLVGAPRHVADFVATEHGVADLRGASLGERAARLIAISAPDHREALRAAWRARLTEF
ncbi:acetyl-CoA hydrolase/transferase family protein [Azoarcus sp. KH32C]|uniref:acetyl-CoA hydrolase/transferase family protein n=1 Tax=Azoarcus sp. KH32C TaxID=748247 RepID=UPI0002385E2F|nr:acetyl-CoA hydrolase/transferase C-terminal domain-containing protein [Azoarcus sp. KH32C]BAL27225.1 acetyl-CoA hydrolase/transferase [Azoarcus sp. KH32C]